MALSSFFALLLGKILKVPNIAKIIAIEPNPFIFNVSNVLQYFTSTIFAVTSIAYQLLRKTLELYFRKML